MKPYGLVLAITFFFSGCNSVSKEKITINNKKWVPKYAKGFSFEEKDGITYLNILNPWPGSSFEQQFPLVSEHDSLKTPESLAIKIPLKRWATSSTSHVGFAEELNEIKSLKALSGANYVSSEDVQRGVNNNEIAELGQTGQPDVEWIIRNKIEVYLNFSIAENTSVQSLLEKVHIPVIYIGEWNEKHPLARAEWIKVFGVLFDKQKQADSIFSTIEGNYLEWKKRAEIEENSPNIISGSLYNGVWYAPQKNSYMQKFYEDANLNYVWKDLEYSGSLQLDIEFVFDTGQSASIWLNSSESQRLSSLEKLNPLISELSSVQNSRVYNTVKSKTSEGVLFYEKGVVRPDLVLKDLIQIGHPNLIKESKLQFFEKLRK
ncbi:MAG: hypothetical protein CMC18_08975 [Flavobacteriaceae bacterium]|nr:hypothetical protein [Flavobacteriaceae bacterium]